MRISRDKMIPAVSLTLVMGAGMAYLKLTQDAKFFKKDIQKLKSLQPHERDTDSLRQKYNISDEDMVKFSKEDKKVVVPQNLVEEDPTWENKRAPRYK